MYKRDGVVRLSQSTVPKYGVNVHNVHVHLIDFHFMKSVIWLWDSIGTIHVTGKFSAKDSWSETLIPGKLASRLIRCKNSVNSTIGRKILSELTEDPTYVSPTYPRFVVLKTMNIYMQWRRKVPKSVCVCGGGGGGGAHIHVIYVPSVKNQYKRVVFGYMVIY